MVGLSPPLLNNKGPAEFLNIQTPEQVNTVVRNPVGCYYNFNCLITVVEEVFFPTDVA